MPSFLGFDIFGEDVTFNAIPNPADEQVDTYAGVKGYEYKNLGERGRRIEVSGRHIGVGAGGFVAAQEAMENARLSRLEGVLYGTLGRSWIGCRLRIWQPEGPVNSDSDGNCMQAYRATFESWE